MKRVLIFIVGASILVLTNCSAGSPKKDTSKAETTSAKVETSETTGSGTVVHITSDEFKKKIFDYANNKEWKYEGSLPCIIDFYADWCMPCRSMSPTMDALAKEYNGKIIIYKVNTDKEAEVAQAFGIQSLPTIVFCPVKGKPQGTVGAQPKEELVKAINEILLTQ